MEHGNGAPPFFPLDQIKQPEELVTTLYRNISFGVGPMLAENDEVIGVMVDWFVPATPWDKKRIMFGQASARSLAMDILMTLDEPAET